MRRCDDELAALILALQAGAVPGCLSELVRREVEIGWGYKVLVVGLLFSRR